MSDTQADVLKALKEEKDKASDTSDLLTKDLAALKKESEAGDKAIEGYEKAIDELKGKKNIHQEYLNNKKGMVDTALGDRKEKVKALITEGEEEIAALKADRVTQDAAHKAKQTTQKEKIKTLEDKQQKYDLEKNLQKKTGDQLAGLEKLRKEIEMWEEENSHEHMFCLLEIFKADLDKIEISDKYREDLNKAWTDLKDARKALREAEVSMKEAERTLRETEKTLEEKEKKQKEEILEKIRNLPEDSTEDNDVD